MPPQPQPSAKTISEVSTTELKYAMYAGPQAVAIYISKLENQNAKLAQRIRDMGAESYRIATSALSLLTGGDTNMLNFSAEDFERLLDNAAAAYAPGGFSDMVSVMRSFEETYFKPSCSVTETWDNKTNNANKKPGNLTSEAEGLRLSSKSTFLHKSPKAALQTHQDPTQPSGSRNFSVQIKAPEPKQCKFYVNGKTCPYQKRDGGCWDIHDSEVQGMISETDDKVCEEELSSKLANLEGTPENPNSVSDDMQSSPETELGKIFLPADSRHVLNGISPKSICSSVRSEIEPAISQDHLWALKIFPGKDEASVNILPPSDVIPNIGSPVLQPGVEISPSEVCESFEKSGQDESARKPAYSGRAAASVISLSEVSPPKPELPAPEPNIKSSPSKVSEIIQLAFMKKMSPGKHTSLDDALANAIHQSHAIPSNEESPVTRPAPKLGSPISFTPKKFPEKALKVTSNSSSPAALEKPLPEVVLQDVSGNVSPVPKREVISKATEDPFVMFLKNKIEEDRKVAQQKVALRASSLGLPFPVKPETASASSIDVPQPQSTNAAMEIEKLNVEDFLAIDRTDLEKHIISLDEAFKSVCPATLTIGKCDLDQTTPAGCNMLKICKNGRGFQEDEPCPTSGCSHMLGTCPWEIKGRHCEAINLGDENKYRDHRTNLVHKDQCGEEEWEQRMVVARLVPAHYDGRYRGREIEDMVASTRWFIDGLFDSRRKIDGMVSLAHRWTT